MPAPRPDRQEHPEKTPPIVQRQATGPLLLSVSTTGEVHGGMAEIRQKLGPFVPGLDRLADGQTDLGTIMIPACRLEITQPNTRFTVDRLTGDVRVRLLATVEQGELTALRMLVAHVQGSGVKNFSETAQQPADSVRDVISQISSSKKKQRGALGSFFHRIGLLMHLESSLRADEEVPELSGQTEGGKHIPTAAELGRKFLGTASDHKTPSGFRMRYLQQLMDVVPKESRQCVRAANANGLKELVSVLDDVVKHPAFTSALESLAKGGANEGGMTSQGLVGGGGGQSERYQKLKSKFTDLQQTAESRLARMQGTVKTYGPPRQQNRHRASGTLGGWSKKGKKTQ